MDLTEYLALCKQVLKHYGFELKDSETLQAEIDKMSDHCKKELENLHTHNKFKVENPVV